MSAYLELKDLSRHFQVRVGALEPPAVLKAVDGVSLELRRGETLGLVGESGCGKSTLARMVVRLLRPTSGELCLEGRSLWSADPQDAAFLRSLPRKVQMIFQDPFSSLNPRQKVGHAVGEGLAIHGLGSHKERRERVLELLDWVGLAPEQAQRYPHEFSGGQRQRVAIARALALGPELLVCDEPVSALDVSIQAQVLNLLDSLQQRLGLTTLFISHDLAVVSHMADRVAVMYLGRLVELAPSRELGSRPLHPYTRVLLAAAPRPEPPPQGATRSRRAVVQGDLPSPVDTPEGCAFEPRCPERQPQCREQRPPLLEAAPGHWVACLLHGQGS